MVGNNNTNNNQPKNGTAQKVMRWIAVGALVCLGGDKFFQKCKNYIKQRSENNFSVNPDEMPKDTLFISEEVFNEAGEHIENGTYDGFPLKKYGQNGNDSILTELSQEVEYEPVPNKMKISKGRRVVGDGDKEIGRSATIKTEYTPISPDDKDKNFELIGIDHQERGQIISKNKKEEVVEENTPVTYGPEGRTGGKKTTKKIKETIVAKKITTFQYNVHEK